VVAGYLDSTFNSFQIGYKFRVIWIRNEFEKYIWSLENPREKCLPKLMWKGKTNIYENQLFRLKRKGGKM